MKRLTAALLAIASCAVLAGCTTTADQIKQDLLGAISRTARISRAYTYAEQAGAHTVAVTATIADDLSYALSAQVDKQAAANEVVIGDQRALRVQDASLLAQMVSSSVVPPTAAGVIVVAPSASASASASPAVTPSAQSSASASASPAAIPAASATPSDPVPAALSAGQWVVDRTGNAGFTPFQSAKYQIGTDPLFDSLEVLKHIVDVVNQGAGVDVFNPEANDYRKDFDPFPAPADGVTRYDIVPPVMAPNNSSTLLSLSGLPTTPNFRRSAVYVRNGTVIDYREQISVASMLADPRSHIQERIGGYGINLPASQSNDQQSALLLRTLNGLLAQKPIRERTLDVSFTNASSSQKLSLPGDAVAGNLSRVGNHGLILFEPS